MDLQKPFDTINHEILLKKLNHYEIEDHYGTENKENDLFYSFFTKRKQYVLVAPQGSTFGPLLYILHKQP